MSSSAAPPPGRPQPYNLGDRVRVRATNRTGTVTYSITTMRGNFVTVRLDGEGKRTQRFLAANVVKIEALF